MATTLLLVACCEDIETNTQEPKYDPGYWIVSISAEHENPDPEDSKHYHSIP